MKKTFTKWLSFAVLAVLAGFGAVAYADGEPADPSLAADVEELYAKEGETAVATIQLNQAGQKIYGVSADIVVPEGFDVEVEGTDADGITTSQTVLASGNIRVAVFSATPFDATITDVLTISVTPTEDDAEGELVLKSVVINYDEDGKPVDHNVDNIEIAVYEGLAPAKNLDFEEGTPVAVGICTYARDIANNAEGSVAQANAVPGWTIAEGTGLTNASGNDAVGDGAAAGTFAYGSDAFLGGANYKVPAEGPSAQALGLVAVWTNKVQYTQTVMLPEGEYALQIPVYNAGGAAAIGKNLIGAIIDGEENFAETTQYAVGEWKTEYVLFTLEEEAEVTFSLGYVSANAGSGNMPKLFIDEVKVLTGEEYEAALLETKRAEALAYLETLPVSPDVFCYPEYIVEEALDEVADAESIEEIEAILEAVNAFQILPYSDTTPYTIQQAVSGMYLNIASAAVTLSDQPQNLNLVATNGGYYITDGTRYVGLTSTNKWNMPTEPDLKTVIAIEPSIEGQNAVYTLGEANGFIGSDEVAANSKCYANKAADADNSKWIIKRKGEIYPVDILEEEAVVENWTCSSNDTFHRNTWSTENDPSGLKTPFIEAWRGAGNNLNNATIAHTQLTGLTPGSYTVTITARLFNEQRTDAPAGVKFVANNAEADLVEAGTTVTWVNPGNNSSNADTYGTYSVDATVTDAGTLDIKFVLENVVGDWLAFKNLKVVFNSENAPAVEKETRRMNDATAEAQDAAVDFFNYYNTPDTYADALAAVANAKEVADFYAENGETIDALTDAAKEIFQPVEDESTDAAELAAALNKALKAQIQAGDDVTALVINNSFETGDLTGWTTTTSGDTGVKSGSTDPYTTDNCDGRWLFNTWNGDATGYDISQTITDMPAGKYKLIALTCGLIGANLDIFANDDAVTVTHESNNHFTETELEFELEEAGDITIGTKNATAWYKADNFRLIFLGAEDGPSTAISNIDKAAQKNGKFLENNTIVIYKNGKKFNLAGQAIQ